MSIFSTVILVIVSIIFGFMLFLLLGCIINLVNKKADYYTQLSIESKLGVSQVQTDLGVKIATTGQLLDICQRLVNIEIANRLKTYVTLNQRYDFVNLDKDIQAVSTNVFNAINFKSINESRLCITKEYIMKNIVDMATLQFMTSIKEVNGLLS